MKFERESWRKLYISESIEHRLLPLFARGLRDYLLRFAEEDGTLIRSKQIDDLCKALNADPKERKAVASAVRELIRIGYLSQDGDRIWITRFQDAQTAKSPGAKRQADYLARRRGGSASDVKGSVTGDTEASVTDDVTGAVTSDVTPDETRRDETRPTTPEVGSSVVRKSDRFVPCPPDLRLTDAQISTLELSGGVPRWAIQPLTVRFIANAQGDPNDRRTPEAWAKCLSQAVMSGWKNPRTRPENPEAGDGAPGTRKAIQLDDLGIKFGTEGL